ncbi:MAG: hypothetical protein C0505_00610 [Leptothrix sp. (in: Bacteria)]|nr:hypothetical protein [Leptothrix sp. (in: b-proteobacteria)]
MRTGSGHFLARCWRGDVPLRQLFWRDMLLVGTMVNLLASFGALMIAAVGAPMPWAAALHFAPVPYNVFLCLSLWRRPVRPQPMALAAAAWLVLVTIV